MNMKTVLCILHWMIYILWIDLAITIQSPIDLLFGSVYLYLIIKRYPVFKIEEKKNDPNARLG
jgi:hypothetical protein